MGGPGLEDEVTLQGHHVMPLHGGHPDQPQARSVVGGEKGFQIVLILYLLTVATTIGQQLGAVCVGTRVG